MGRRTGAASSTRGMSWGLVPLKGLSCTASPPSLSIPLPPRATFASPLPPAAPVARPAAPAGLGRPLRVPPDKNFEMDLNSLFCVPSGLSLRAFACALRAVGLALGEGAGGTSARVDMTCGAGPLWEVCGRRMDGGVRAGCRGYYGSGRSGCSCCGAAARG
jgi:hypothetical protein